jgi:short-subunit dehydrogenase
MAYGDIHYNIYASGSTILNNASQNLFGDYSGLSNLNLSDVIEINVQSMNVNNYLVAASTLSNNSGVRVAAGSPITLLPMRVRNASTRFVK